MSESKELLINFTINCLFAGITMWAGYKLMKQLDPTREVYDFVYLYLQDKERSQKAAEALKLRLKKSGRNNLEFTDVYNPLYYNK